MELLVDVLLVVFGVWIGVGAMCVLSMARSGNDDQ